MRRFRRADGQGAAEPFCGVPDTTSAPGMAGKFRDWVRLKVFLAGRSQAGCGWAWVRCRAPGRWETSRRRPGCTAPRRAPGWPHGADRATGRRFYRAAAQTPPHPPCAMLPALAPLSVRTPCAKLRRRILRRSRHPCPAAGGGRRQTPGPKVSHNRTPAREPRPW